MTILFAKDWARYPTATLHLETKNESALRIAALLKQMGVKNHCFMLALYNEELRYVDPYDENLTEHQKMYVGKECRENFWYFIREVLRPPGHSGNSRGIVRRFNFNRANIALYWYYWNHIRIYLEMIRQSGKSFPTDVLSVYLNGIRCNSSIMFLYTRGDELRCETTSRIRKIYDGLPAYLDVRDRTDTKNQDTITVNKLKNKYLTGIAQPSEKDADSVARGISFTTGHIDEGPFCKNFKTSLPAMLAASTAAIEDAKMNDEPYGFIFTSSAGVLGRPESDEYYRLLQDAASHTERYYDIENREELVEVIERATRGGKGGTGTAAVYAPFNHRQIGRSDEWLLETINKNSSTGAAADKDYFLIWQHTGGVENPLDGDLRQEMMSSIATPKWVDIDREYKYTINWYYTFDELLSMQNYDFFVMAVDSSDASGGDDIGIVITSTITGAVLGQATVNETNLYHFSIWLGRLIAQYDRMVTIIERKSSGPTIIDYLLHYLPSIGLDPFKKLFNRVVNDYMEDKRSYNEILTLRRTPELYVKYKKSFGFSTSSGGKTDRSELYSTTLQNSAVRTADRIHSRILANQINSLIRKNGVVGHESGNHDDQVIAWLLCNWLLMSATNLAYYGINPLDAYTNCRKVVNKDKKVSKADEARENEQKAMIARINGLAKKLEDTKDEFIAIKIQQEMKALNDKMDYQGNNIMNMDALIQDSLKARGELMKNSRRGFAGKDGINYTGRKDLTSLFRLSHLGK